MTTILEQCKALVAAEKTEDALTLLVRGGNDSSLILKARYNQALKQRETGMIDAGEFDRIVRQVNYALPELAATIPDARPAESDDLRSLLADLLPYFHDLQVGFLEPKAQSAGYDRRTIQDLYTRLVEATK